MNLNLYSCCGFYQNVVDFAVALTLQGHRRSKMFKVEMGHPPFSVSKL